MARCTRSCTVRFPLMTSTAAAGCAQGQTDGRERHTLLRRCHCRHARLWATCFLYLYYILVSRSRFFLSQMFGIHILQPQVYDTDVFSPQVPYRLKCATSVTAREVWNLRQEPSEGEEIVTGVNNAMTGKFMWWFYTFFHLLWMVARCIILPTYTACT